MKDKHRLQEEKPEVKTSLMFRNVSNNITVTSKCWVVEFASVAALTVDLVAKQGPGWKHGCHEPITYFN